MLSFHLVKILSISTERRIFDKESEVHSRAFSYSELFDELHIVVFNTRKNLKIDTEKNQYGEKLFVYPTNSINRWFYVFDAIKTGQKIIKEKKLNRDNSYITTQDPFETGLTGWFLSLKSKIELNIQIHTDIFSPYFKKGHLLNIFRISISNFIIPKADSIRVVSRNIKDSVINKFNVDKNKITILPIIVDKEKIINSEINEDLRKKYSQFDFIFLVISRLEKEKNIPIAIESFKEVVKQNPRAGLIIVGDGNWKNILKKLVRNYKLENNIIFEGWKNSVNSYLKTADVLVSASFYEGYGMIFIEAVLCGCPIISSNVGIVKDKFTDGEDAVICDSEDKECFLRAMVKFIEDPNLGRELVQNAKHLVENSENIILDKKEYLERYKKQFEL